MRWSWGSINITTDAEFDYLSIINGSIDDISDINIDCFGDSSCCESNLIENTIDTNISCHGSYSCYKTKKLKIRDANYNQSHASYTISTASIRSGTATFVPRNRTSAARVRRQGVFGGVVVV